MARQTKIRPKRTSRAGVRAVEAVSDHRFPRHSHDEFGIGLVTAGAQRSYSGRGEVEAVTGDVITVTPGEVHDGAPLGSRPRAWSMLYLEPQVVAEVIAGEEGSAGRYLEFHGPVLQRPALAARFRRLYGRITSNRDWDDGLALAEALTALLAAAVRHRRADDRMADADVRRAVSLMDDDPATPLTLEDLACAAGLSRYQVIRGVSRLTGLTPHAYLTQRRLEQARRLIQCGTPLAEAALASGFYDQSHLNRTFRRRYGFTPGSLASSG